MKKSLFIFLTLISLSFSGSSQLFTEVTTASFPGVYIGNCSWGNYNNDGFLDLFLTGYGTSSVRISKIYMNSGDGTFPDIGAPITQVGNSFGEWGDFNNDNIIDLTYGGNVTSNPTSTAQTKLYSNTGPGTFTEIPTGFPAFFHPAIAWGDYDNDGDQDIVYGGELNVSQAVCQLYQNNGNGQFSPKQVLDSISDGALAFGDYDNDGYLDLAVTGRIGSFNYITKLYHNNGNDSLINSGQLLTGLRTSSVAWGDYDSDGDLDLLLTGSDNSDVLFSIIYKNNNGSFVNISAALIPVRYGKASWGDYDNDGDLDILLIGQIDASGSVMITTVYKNNGGDVFSEVTGLSLPGLRRSYAAWGDYNNDGKLDFFINGRTSGGTYMSKLYRNNTTNVNTAPTIPTGLSSVRVGDTITLSWNASTDGQTPSAGLSYNLRIGTTPGGSEICSPMANTSNGFRNLAQIGNMNLRRFFSLKNLPDGNYYWSVQAIDNAFTGSAFAPEQSFIISNNKILNLTYFLEGLFNGTGMNKAQDESGDHFSGTVADHISIGLRNSSIPYDVIHEVDSVNLNVDGNAVSLIPSTYSDSYFLSIKHRNSIETWSAIPVDFSANPITYSFDTPLKAFGNNMGLMTGGIPVAYSGDANQDGIVDGSDLSDIGNLADIAASGYIPEDINGDGLIDGSDLSATGNNADAAIGSVTP